MLHHAFLVVAAMTTGPAGDPAVKPLVSDFATGHEQVILSCSSPQDPALHATLGPIPEGRPETSGGAIELVEVAGRVMVRRQVVVDGQRVSQRLSTRHLAGGHGEPFYHLEFMSKDGGPAHLFFTVNADQSGWLMWSTAENTVETNCLAG